MKRVLAIAAACGTNQTPQPMPAPALPSCLPNRDGVITADELPIALGATENYYAGTNRPVTLVPQAGVYDLSQERPDDMSTDVAGAAGHDHAHAISLSRFDDPVVLALNIRMPTAAAD